MPRHQSYADLSHTSLRLCTMMCQSRHHRRAEHPCELCYPFVVYVFQIFHAANVKHGYEVCNSRKRFDLCAIFL